MFLLYKQTLFSNNMRKLEEQMNQAIRGQRNWAGSNTTVFTTDNGLESTVYLHGNHIATYFHDTRELQLTMVLLYFKKTGNGSYKEISTHLIKLILYLVCLLDKGKD